MSLEVNITKKLDGFTLHANFAARSTATAILGASGCGKSMTLRCIAGIVKPDAGRIVLDGRVLFDSAQHIDLPPQQRGVGLLFQNYALFPNMTVEQNVLCGLKAEKDKAARKARCAEMLQAMRLESLAKRYPAQLSGGQQQRTALARCFGKICSFGSASPARFGVNSTKTPYDSTERTMPETVSPTANFAAFSIHVPSNSLCDKPIRKSETLVTTA